MSPESNLHLLTEDLVSIPDAAKLFPSSARPHQATVWRWQNRGLRGVKLETVRIGQHRFTSRQAVTRFLERTQQPA
ncbi:DUF1580 domain-containing protein [Roseiconus nitratireducens]|uniref:DUF1580 domain-containing protein n=1 Tax=Roseiconus nitratireducens TaxID=2605748 RepID=A0A5M6DER5_9BACT|nr:DUF1580 domain-containing protein [Roseiconus nitratireducens]KAA5546027.1 DUF1580 domain-containing protein [Roseiconus nitratireducens]